MAGVMDALNVGAGAWDMGSRMFADTFNVLNQGFATGDFMDAAQPVVGRVIEGAESTATNVMGAAQRGVDVGEDAWYRSMGGTQAADGTWRLPEGGYNPDMVGFMADQYRNEEGTGVVDTAQARFDAAGVRRMEDLAKVDQIYEDSRGDLLSSKGDVVSNTGRDAGATMAQLSGTAESSMNDALAALDAQYFGGASGMTSQQYEQAKQAVKRRAGVDLQNGLRQVNVAKITEINRVTAGYDAQIAQMDQNFGSITATMSANYASVIAQEGRALGTAEENAAGAAAYAFSFDENFKKSVAEQTAMFESAWAGNLINAEFGAQAIISDAAAMSMQGLTTALGARLGMQLNPDNYATAQITLDNYQTMTASGDTKGDSSRSAGSRVAGGASGALTGVAAGAPFGPAGMIVGGTVGGVSGAVGD